MVNPVRAYRAGRIAGGVAVGAVATGLGIVGLSALLGPDTRLSLLGDNAFPSDLDSYKHYITFDFVEYKRRSIFDRAFLSGRGSIRLPIPANLVDQQSVDYQPTPTDLVTGSFIEAGLGKNSDPIKGAAGALGGAGAQALLSTALRNSDPGGLLGKLAGAAPQALQMGGLAINPFLTVLFKSPTFKRHSFAWRLSPNTPQESTTLNNILTKFKYHMLPARGDGVVGAILKYPDMCLIKLLPKEDFLYRFKPCVVESISVNYAPNGNPSFFAGTKAPTDIQFTVNFLEIEYWLKEDFQGGVGGTLGFASSTIGGIL